MHGLFQTENLATQNVMTDKSLHISCVLSWIILRVQTELATYEAVSVKFYNCVSVYFPQLFCMHIDSFLRRITLSPVAYLTLPYLSTLSHKRQEWLQISWNIKCVLMYLTIFIEIILIQRRIQRGIIIRLRGSSRKAHGILIRC